jgi:hypothetical protein
VDRITDGVAVILVEEDEETVDEVHIEEIPSGIHVGDKVHLHSDDGGETELEAVDEREETERRLEEKLKRLRSRGKKTDGGE